MQLLTDETETFYFSRPCSDCCKETYRDCANEEKIRLIWGKYNCRISLDIWPQAGKLKRSGHMLQMLTACVSNITVTL